MLQQTFNTSYDQSRTHLDLFVTQLQLNLVHVREKQATKFHPASTSF